MGFVRRVWQSAALLLALAHAMPARCETAGAYELMALYTYNFAKFTTWPARGQAPPDAPLNLCVLGEDPFGTALTNIEGQRVQNRSLAVKRFPRVALLGDCHIVFVSRSEQWRLDAILNNLAALPILTVSDIPDFSKRGGMITLVLADQKLRFDINAAAVERSGLKLSSKLLELARIVDAGGAR
ncbi:MAG: YfiR family protein [Gammaproteobacteria bacterium]